MADPQSGSGSEQGRDVARRHVTYKIGASQLHIVFGDISTATTDVIVTSDDTQLSMGGGTSKAVLRAAGETLREEAQRQTPVKLGGVISTSAGQLATRGVKNVFHAATIRDSQDRAVDDVRAVIKRATGQAIDLLKAMKLRSIAMPALGTGHARFKPQDVAVAMTEALQPALLQSNEPLEVELWLLWGAKRDYEMAEFLSEFTDAAKLRSEVVKKHGVVLLHGIRTAAGWRRRIGEEIRAADSGLTPIPIGYGFFNIVRFLVPGPWRKAAAETVWKKMKPVFDNPNLDRVSIISHSFGTWIVGHLLRHQDGLKFHRIVFCGAVLDSHYDWHLSASKISGPPFPRDPVVRVINDCGTLDIWPIFARFATWGYDVSGRVGFGNALVYDRHHTVDHSGFFESGFAAEYWVPALTRNHIEPGKAAKTEPPYWQLLLSQLKLPYLLLLVLAALAAWLYWGR